MSDFIKFSHQLADESGKVIRQYFRTKLEVEDKSDDSPVTVADRETEMEMRKLIQKKYPDHDILGEEHGYKPTGSRWTWVLDPIDGTRSFVSGMPTFGTLISLLDEGRPVLGIIDMPILNERWFAEQNSETVYSRPNVSDDSKICKVTGQKKLEESILFSTDPAMFNEQQKPFFDQVAEKAKLTRFGGDCYCYGLLASGFVDLVVEADLKKYDVMALIPVVESAGGRMSDWSGNRSFSDDWDGTMLASASKELHEQTLKLLQV